MGAAPQPGQPAPDATLTGPDGAPVTLRALWQQAPLLLVFYPGDDTPVCTRQLCSYRDRFADFRAAGVQLVGINPAAADRHAGFAARHALPFPLLSDADGACCRAYGAQAWYGTRRQLVLIDRAGTVRWVHRTLPFLRPSPATVLAGLASLPPAG
jgi:peroxiredoxin Q/BCP